MSTMSLADRLMNLMRVDEEAKIAIDKLSDGARHKYLLQLAREEQLNATHDALRASWTALDRVRLIAERTMPGEE